MPAPPPVKQSPGKWVERNPGDITDEPEINQISAQAASQPAAAANPDQSQNCQQDPAPKLSPTPERRGRNGDARQSAEYQSTQI
jgi:hypothetical protein